MRCTSNYVVLNDGSQHTRKTWRTALKGETFRRYKDIVFYWKTRLQCHVASWLQLTTHLRASPAPDSSAHRFSQRQHHWQLGQEEQRFFACLFAEQCNRSFRKEPLTSFVSKGQCALLTMRLVVRSVVVSVLGRLEPSRTPECRTVWSCERRSCWSLEIDSHALQTSWHFY